MICVYKCKNEQSNKTPITYETPPVVPTPVKDDEKA
jgi:hypothetical protein